MELARDPVQQQHAFLDLARSRDWETLFEKLKEDPGLVNVQPCGRWSALHQAALVGDAVVVRRLLECNADVNVKTSDDKQPKDIAPEGPAKALLTHAGRARKRRPDFTTELDWSAPSEGLRKRRRISDSDITSLPELPAEQMPMLTRSESGLNDMLQIPDSPSSRQLLEEQSILTHSRWSHIREGDVDTVLAEIRQTPGMLHDRGPLGETPLHLLVLYRHFDLARAVATRYPRLLLDRYLQPLYEGETSLHIAIVGRNLDFVRFILETARREHILDELMSIKATGTFFQKGSHCYYGESPLGFAVSTNMVQIVREMILSFGASMEVVDSDGNNLLHLVVYHRLPEMHDVITSLWASWCSREGGQEGRIPLCQRRNKEGLTPLCLAAKYGFTDIFEYMLQQRIETEWNYGPLTSVLLPLDDLDYVPGVCTGAVEHIIQEGHLGLLMLPLIQELYQRKWDKFAKDLFWIRIYWAVTRAVCFTFMVVLDPGALQEEGGNANLWLLREIVHVACKVFVVVNMVHKFKTEIKELRQEGFSGYFGGNGAMFFENVVSSATAIIFLSAMVLELLGSSLANPMLAVSGLFMWIYLLWFLLGFSHAGHLVVMVWKILTGDMVRFALVTSLIIMGFSVAFFIAQTHPSDRGPSVFGGYIYDCLHMMTSGFDKADGKQGDSITSSLLLSYTVVATVLLLNILIAMMNDTYQNVSQEAEQQWKLERARIITSIEQELDPNQREKNKYWLEIKGDKYLRLEQVTDWARS